MAAQQIYMFPEEHIAKLEMDLNNMRRSLFARVNEIEKEMRSVNATCEGNTLDFIEIKKLLEDAKEAVI